uniref:Peptidase A1 domain-containing protein n=1 Tax=Kalanchoe fedtschenkoi TaxID=63787 RepID=A0A7N0U059_KALFE
MASSCLLLLLQLLFFHLISQSSSSSLPSTPIVLPLTHTLSRTQKLKTSHRLLKGTSTLNAAVSLPLSSGSDYTLTFSIGSSSPPQAVSMYMDTGSDVVWLPCSPFECILCDGEQEPPPLASSATQFNLNASSTATAVHCSSPHCSAVHSAAPTSDLCAISRCPLDSIELSDCPASSTCPPFYYAYGDGSFVAQLHSDHLSLIPSLKLHNFTFGCAHTTLGEPVGVAGFGRGKLSLPAQLAAVSPHLGNHFSYCLISHSFKPDKLRRPSPLILGRRDNDRLNVNGGEKTTGPNKLVYTPMLRNPKHPYFYCVGLTGISIGKKLIPAPASMSRVDSNGDGGLVVDSGTTYTMLPPKFYQSLVAEFGERVSRIGKRLSQPESTTGMSHCYYLNDDVAEKRGGTVPSMTLHFGGNGSSSVRLPRRNYFYEFLDSGDESKRKRRVGCLMLMEDGDEMESEGGGPSGILGNYFQQGFEVVYDLERERIGFVRRRCDSLWDELN